MSPKKSKTLLALIAFSLFVTMPVWADDAAAGSAPATAVSTDQTAAHPTRQKVEALKRLKTENPSEYQRVIRARKAAVKKKLQELKKNDPQKFQEIRQRIIRQRKERLERMRRENPAKFQQVMQKKRQKLETMRQTDPERYARFLKKHPKLAASLSEQASGRPTASGRPAAAAAPTGDHSR